MGATFYQMQRHTTKAQRKDSDALTALPQMLKYSFPVQASWLGDMVT